MISLSFPKAVNQSNCSVSKQEPPVVFASLEQTYILSLEMADSTGLCKCPDQTIAVCLNIASCSPVKILPLSPAQCPCACSPGGWMATALHLPQSPSFRTKIAGSWAQNTFTAFLCPDILGCNVSRRSNNQWGYPGMDSSSHEQAEDKLSCQGHWEPLLAPCLGYIRVTVTTLGNNNSYLKQP